MMVNAIVGAILHVVWGHAENRPNLAPKFSGCQRLTAKASEGTGAEYDGFSGLSANGGEQ